MQVWRRCSACKEPIAPGAQYWVCSVSTCNRKRTGLAFCSVSCWEVHLPSARHREAWALERTAPGPADAAPRASRPEPGDRRSPPAAQAPAEAPPRRRLVRPERGRADDVPREVLVVASRLKAYVRARSGGFNTSDGVLEPLSDLVRRAVDRAIRNAERDGRRTVLERDVGGDDD